MPAIHLILGQALMVHSQMSPMLVGMLPPSVNSFLYTSYAFSVLIFLYLEDLPLPGWPIFIIAN